MNRLVLSSYGWWEDIALGYSILLTIIVYIQRLSTAVWAHNVEGGNYHCKQTFLGMYRYR
jgi:hypothetical protein